MNLYGHFFLKFQRFHETEYDFQKSYIFHEIIKNNGCNGPWSLNRYLNFWKICIPFQEKNPILLLLGTFDLDSNLTRTLIELYFRCMIIFQNAVFNNWILNFFSIFSYAKIENMGLDIPLFCIHLRWVESLNLVKNNICILLDFFFSSALKVRDMNL